jgi:hypothetical protein
MQQCTWVWASVDTPSCRDERPLGHEQRSRRSVTVSRAARLPRKATTGAGTVRDRLALLSAAPRLPRHLVAIKRAD